MEDHSRGCEIIMGLTPFPVEEHVENYRKMSENKNNIKATDARIYGDKEVRE